MKNLIKTSLLVGLSLLFFACTPIEDDITNYTQSIEIIVNNEKEQIELIQHFDQRFNDENVLSYGIIAEFSDEVIDLHVDRDSIYKVTYYALTFDNILAVLPHPDEYNTDLYARSFVRLDNEEKTILYSDTVVFNLFENKKNDTDAFALKIIDKVLNITIIDTIELTIDYTKSPYIVTSAPEYLNVNLTTDYKTVELGIEIKSTGYRFSNNITLNVNTKNISIKSISFSPYFITIIYNDTNWSGIY